MCDGQAFHLVRSTVSALNTWLVIIYHYIIITLAIIIALFGGSELLAMPPCIPTACIRLYGQSWWLIIMLLVGLIHNNH